MNKPKGLGLSLPDDEEASEISQKPVPQTDKAGDQKKKMTFDNKDQKGGSGALDFEHLRTVSSILTPSSKSSSFLKEQTINNDYY